MTSFLENPKPLLLSGLLPWTGYLPVRLTLSFPLPDFLIKHFLFGKNANESMISSFFKVLKLIPSEIISFRLDQIRKLTLEVKVLDSDAVYLQASDDKLVPHKSVTRFKEVFDNLEIKKIVGPHF